MDPDIAVVGEAADGAEAIAMLPSASVDVLLLDIRMPGKDGLEVLRALAAAAKLPPTLILTTFDDSDVVLDGIRAGARGFMLKDVSYQQLIAAIRAVAGGATVFQPAVTERLLRAGTRARTDAERKASRPYSDRESLDYPWLPLHTARVVAARELKGLPKPAKTVIRYSGGQPLKRVSHVTSRRVPSENCASARSDTAPPGFSTPPDGVSVSFVSLAPSAFGPGAPACNQSSTT